MQDDRVRGGPHPGRRRSSGSGSGTGAGWSARGAWIGLSALLAAGAAQATSCEKVMAPIEARIRAKGVTDFHLEAVDLAASAPGRPVGTCDLGRKKILYVRGASSASGASGASGAPGAAAPAGARASAPRVITECADGRVIEQGSCRKK